MGNPLPRDATNIKNITNLKKNTKKRYLLAALNLLNKKILIKTMMRILELKNFRMQKQNEVYSTQSGT